MMNLVKTKKNRGTMKLIHDTENGVICGQWVDSKVVNFVSSYEDIGYGTVNRQIGSKKIEFNCPNILKMYQQTMGAIDRGDQMRVQGGGFATHVHFKKWYKRTYLAILDCMLLNAYIAWNLSTKPGPNRAPGRMELTRAKFYTIVAQEMCAYEEEKNDFEEDIIEPSQQRRSNDCGDHIPLADDDHKRRCTVCLVEYRMKSAELGSKGLFRCVAKCSKCDLAAHTMRVFDFGRRGWRIHNLQPFQGLTCFEILHSDVGKQIWRPSEDRKSGRFSYTTSRKHPLILSLRKSHGFDKLKRKRKRGDEIDDNMDDVEETEEEDKDDDKETEEDDQYEDAVDEQDSSTEDEEDVGSNYEEL